MSFWTERRLEILKREGSRVYPLPAVEIAALIGDGCTKNMICGKLGRMGMRLTTRMAASATPEEKQARKLERNKMRSQRYREAHKSALGPLRPRFVQHQPKPTAQIMPFPEMKKLRLEQLEPTSCRWISGDVKHGDWFFCGNETDQTYCVTHANLCYNRGRV